MRIQRGSRLVWGLLLLALTGLTARAQGPGRLGRANTPKAQPAASQRYSGDEEIGSAVVPLADPGEAEPVFGVSFEQAAGGPPPGYPEYSPPGEGGVVPAQYGEAGDAYPWPAVSPYDNRFDQTRNERGLWFRQFNNSPNEFYTGVDFLAYQYKKPGGAGNEPDKQIGFPIRLDAFTQLRVSRLDVIADNIGTSGLKAFWGFKAPDESGAEISGTYLGARTENIPFAVQTRLPQPRFNPGNPADLLNFIDRTAIINRVDLNTGFRSASPLTFDTHFRGTYHAFSYGGEANMFTTPFIGRGSNMVRGIIGARYLAVDERLNIDARDTVAGQTLINSSVDSHLFGPQIGARWDIGGKALKLKMHLTGGALGNFGTLKIDATNYGGRQANLEERHTHISPMLDTGIQAEMPLFGYLPVLKRIPVVKEGIFRVGFNYTAVFLMDRPADTITYGDPLPVFDTDRSTWDLRGVNVGIQWDW